MELLRKYGVATNVYLPIVKRAVVDFALSADWTPAAGDVKISKDGGAAANVTTLPVAITMGNTAMWNFALSATEMQAAKVMVTVGDAATKAVEDQMFIIATYGNASAEYAADLDDADDLGLTALTGHTPQSGDAFARLGAPAGASVSADIAAIEAQTDDIGAAGAGLTALATQASVDAVQADTNDIQARLPAALDTGRIVAKAEVVSDKTGYALTSAEQDAIVNKLWDELTSEARTAGSYGQLLKDNVNAAITSRAVAGDAMALTAGAVDAVHDEVFEGTLTFRQFQRIALAALAGKSTGFPAGPAKYRDNADTKDRISATVDADGNRSVVTLDGA